MKPGVWTSAVAGGWVGLPREANPFKYSAVVGQGVQIELQYKVKLITAVADNEDTRGSGWIGAYGLGRMK